MGVAKVDKSVTVKKKYSTRTLHSKGRTTLPHLT
jgi:hypothetical protein